jgi:hypothetical protein
LRMTKFFPACNVTCLYENKVCCSPTTVHSQLPGLTITAVHCIFFNITTFLFGPTVKFLTVLKNASSHPIMGQVSAQLGERFALSFSNRICHTIKSNVPEHSCSFYSSVIKQTGPFYEDHLLPCLIPSCCLVQRTTQSTEFSNKQYSLQSRHYV